MMCWQTRMWLVVLLAWDVPRVSEGNWCDLGEQVLRTSSDLV